MENYSHTHASENNGMRVVHIDDLSAPATLQPDEQESYQRRFSTFFIDEGRCREGGLGRVFFGKNAWGEPLAIKVMDDSLAPSDKQERNPAAEAFQREYETMRSLSGVRGFPRLYGMGLFEGRNAIIMEWIEGETLATAIRHLSIDDERRLSPLTAAQLGRDLFALLARMEIIEDGIVHRDISTSNIMIDTSTRSLDEQAEAGRFDLRLVDFGSAILPARSSSLTQRYGTPRGATPDFAPPEMLTEDIANISAMRKNPAVDVYAAASVLYLLLGGHAPFDFEGKDDRTRSYYLMKTEDLPGKLRGVHEVTTSIDATLEHEPQTAAFVRAALKETGAQPSDEKIAAALSAVDGQLTDMVFACLDPVQEYRPLAAEMQESLEHFVDSYGENVRSALEEQPLMSCTSRAFERRARSANTQRTRRWNLGAYAVGAILLLATSIATAVLAGSIAATFTLGPIQWSGRLNGWIVGMLLWVPALFGYVARLATRKRRSSLVWAGGCIATTALVLLAAILLTSFAPPATLWLMIGALAISATVSWCVISFDVILDREHSTPIGKSPNHTIEARE